METTQVVELTTETLRSDRQEEPVLAAALAALLVDYGRYTSQRGEHNGSQKARNNWRLLSRWEQLRG